ncbi:MAG: hypothetical protein IKO78_03170 [Bacilli bacterium]|nr:hypothetical protein [Bacilli bacterium]
MSNLKLDYNALDTEIKSLRNVKADLDEVFDYIEQNNNLLKEYWETKTSKEVFESFEDFYKHIMGIKANFQRDINFLQRKVFATYSGANKDIDTQIETKI